MSRTMDYHQAVEYLYSLQKFGIKLGLSSTERLLDRLGRPQDRLTCLHLAGSNGKGSVGAMAVSVLEAAGLRPGFYTSPHLIHFEERFVIDRRNMDRARVVDLVQRVRGVCSAEEPPTFFEFVTAMGLLYFAEEKVDPAVIETGLGGRLDATNIVDAPVAVITNISLEHTQYLGPRLEDVAREKAGIIKPWQQVITGERRPKVLALFQKRAHERGADLYRLGKDFSKRNRSGGRFDYHGLSRVFKNLDVNLIGAHQRTNAALALAALEALSRHGYHWTEDQARQGLMNVRWPGRGELFAGRGGRADLLLDGAHNPAAARTLAGMLPGLGYRRVVVVVGVMEDKDVAGVLKPLLAAADQAVLTRPRYHRAASVDALAAAAGDFRGPVETATPIEKAVETAYQRAEAQDLVVVTGSLFTAGEARAYLTRDQTSVLTG